MTKLDPGMGVQRLVVVLIVCTDYRACCDATMHVYKSTKIIHSGGGC